MALLIIAGCSEGTATTGAMAVASTAVAVAPAGGDTGLATTPATSTPTTTTTTTTPSTTRISASLTTEQVAAALTLVERAAATGDGSVGVRQQLLYRYLAANPRLDDAVLAAVGDDVRPYIERIVRARQLGQARQTAVPNPTPPTDMLPAWTVVEPLPEDELLADYHDADAATGIGWFWIAAIHLQETRMGRIIGTSSAGAVGPMQFLPETWKRCCTGDPLIPRDAIIGAATYLGQSGGPADMQAALHEYNPNDSYVATVTAFAENMRDNPRLYAAYRQWQVFYATSAGTVRLPVGYSQGQPIDAAHYLASNPVDAG